jgi:hypothetical protein
MSVTSIAVVAFFRRDRRGESAWAALAFPTLAALLIGAVAVLATAHFALLIGVDPADPARDLFPILFGLIAAAGVVVVTFTKLFSPVRYAALKVDTDPVVLQSSTAAMFAAETA